ncbi:MAG: hypothetical protein B6I38_07885 [Anaerolineaceae bacterium 4572_5.1]|nr:MAG: hypothetical protein B6I38_07885 [Anaerolineaceae bacterium 4572_5.1]
MRRPQGQVCEAVSRLSAGRLLTCTATPAPQSGAALGARSAAQVSAEKLPRKDTKEKARLFNLFSFAFFSSVIDLGVFCENRENFVAYCVLRKKKRRATR